MEKLNRLIEKLIELEISTKDSFEEFHHRTRDIEDLKVLKCNKSGVIVLSEIRTNQEYYEENQNYSSEENITNTEEGNITSPPLDDDLRRFNDYKNKIKGKNILDFGCGKGGFLSFSKKIAKGVLGVELNTENRSKLISQGISCVKDLKEIGNEENFDLITLNHVIEHIEKPVDLLNELSNLLTSRGEIIIEVPHARDVLIETFKNKPFINFTLWSEHLLLHTKSSLKEFIDSSGLICSKIYGIQRYPVSNLLYWLWKSKPGGHKVLKGIGSKQFHSEYEKILENLDQTDTIIAICKRK